MLGLDKANKRIAIKPITKQEVERGAIPEEKRHKITVRPSYARVCNKKFIKEAAEVAKIDLSENNALKFKTLWSSEHQALIIDLSEIKGELK